MLVYLPLQFGNLGTCCNLSIYGYGVLKLSLHRVKLVAELLKGGFNFCLFGLFDTDFNGSAYGQLIGYKYKRDNQGRLLLKDGLPQNNGEQVSLGCGVYKYVGGWSNTLKYRDFSLSFLIDYKFGAKLFSGSNYQAYSNGLHKNTLVGRTKENPNQTYVRGYWQAEPGGCYCTELLR